MKKILIVLITIITCSFNRQKPNVIGDLYYSWLKIGSFYNQPDSLYQNYVELRDSVGLEELVRRDSNGFFHVELLEKHDLLKSPFIYLKINRDSILTVYMNPKLYNSITKYSHQDLIDKNKKVRLKLVTEPIADKIHICKQILYKKKVKGQTYQMSRKWEVEDYR